jgi:hypothetical protein
MELFRALGITLMVLFGAFALVLLVQVARAAIGG